MCFCLIFNRHFPLRPFAFHKTVEKGQLQILKWQYCSISGWRRCRHKSNSSPSTEDDSVWGKDYFSKTNIFQIKRLHKSRYCYFSKVWSFYVVFTIAYALIILLQFSVVFHSRGVTEQGCVHRFVALPLCVFLLFCFPHYLTPFRILLKDQLNPCKWCESGSSYNHWLCRWVSVKFSFLRYI